MVVREFRTPALCVAKRRETGREYGVGPDQG